MLVGLDKVMADVSDALDFLTYFLKLGLQVIMILAFGLSQLILFVVDLLLYLCNFLKKICLSLLFGLSFFGC